MNRKILIKITAVFLLQLVLLRSAAQNITVFRIDEDNPQLKISKLYKNSRGIIYAGTNNGLYKFDGLGFTKLPIPDSFNRNNITAIFDDGKTLWVGFQRGQIWQISNSQAKAFSPEEGLPVVAITDIIKDKQNRTWFATGGEGIYIYDTRLHNINTDDSLSDDYVYDLEADDKGNIVAGTDRGLNFCRFENGKKQVRKFTTANGLTDNIVRAIQYAGDGYYIAGLQDKGLQELKLNANGAISSNISYSDWPYGQVNSLSLKENKILIATETGVFQSVFNGRLSGLKKISVANSNMLQAFSDNENNFWFTPGSELVKTFGDKLNLLLTGDEKSMVDIHSLFACSHQYLWVSEKKLVKQFLINDSGARLIKTYPINSIGENSEISSLYCSDDGLLWIGTMGSGVILLDPATGQYRSINEEPLLKGASILCVSGKDSTVWISYLGGVLRCNSGANKKLNSVFSFTAFNDISGIGSSYIYYIYTDSRKRVWFATDGKGISVLENGRFKNYSGRNYIKSEVIYSITEDKKGHLWFSTNDAGLYEFDGTKFINYTIEKGLSDLNILSVTADEKGNIIIIHPRSVDILNTATGVTSYIDKDWGIDHISNYLNTAARDSQGNIFFNTSRGLFRLNCAEFPAVNKPFISLDLVSLFLKPIDTVLQKSFHYDENNFSFSFSGIYYSDPEKMRYQYNLEGFNNQWISTRDKEVNFPKLPPGNYTFRVRVSLSDNFENAAEAHYSFIIEKPFWKRWWFLALVAVTGFFLLRFIIKEREKRLQKWDRLEKEKAQFQYETLKNQVNPHFLFNSFNTLISVIEENPGTATDYVQHLSDFYRSIVNFREKDLITLEEEVTLINNYFFIQQKRYGNNLQPRISLSEAEKKELLIPPLTLQLLAENAVKHNAVSKETPLLFEVFISNDKLLVRNNLNEKINKEAGEGMGLQNIANRYALISGKEVEIKKDEQYFTVVLPLIKPMI